jgi:gamma-glutamyl phosphate reductase
MNMMQIAKQAKEASIHLAAIKSEVKNRALADISRALMQKKA